MFPTRMEDGRSGEPDATIVDRVRQAAIAELDGASFAGLDRCVTDTVTRLSTGTISCFVPLLALREVRCCIAAGTCDCGSC